MKTLSLILLFASQTQAMKVNQQDATDKYEPHHTPQFLATRNFNLKHVTPLNLEGKKYQQFDMADEQIPWDGKDRYELMGMLRQHVDLHQSPNKSSINWGGVPDALVEKIKEQGFIPERGIPNRVMMMGVFEPTWFRSWNQQYLPNNTEFMYIDYDKMDSMVAMISKEMEKVGVEGAEKAYHLVRPFAYKKNFLQWMALWHYGGMFMDAKQGWTRPVSDWVDFKNDELVGCSDPSMITDDQFIMMAKHHPFGLMMTQNQINNVKNRDYYDGHDGQRYTDLNVTGPDAYRTALMNTHQGTWTNFRCSKERNATTNQYNGFLLDGKEAENRTMIFKNDPVPKEEVFFLMKKCDKCNDYKTLFRNRQLYCDQPGPTLGCNGKNYTFYQDENSWKAERTVDEEWAKLPEDKEFNQTAVAQEKLRMHDLSSFKDHLQQITNETVKK